MPAAVSPTLWPVKDPAEAFPVAFDFTDALLGAETVATAAIAISTRSGTDATPTAVLDGASVQDGARILQRVQGGVSGASYLLRCAATTSDDRVLVLAAVLPVKALT